MPTTAFIQRRMIARDNTRRRSRLMRDDYPRQNVMRDIAPAVVVQNNLPPPTPLSTFGWMGQALGDMGNNARWASSLNPDNELIAANLYPLETLATTPAALLNACLIAVAGSAGKTYTSVSWPSTPAAQTLVLTANTQVAFGARVRISNALTTFKFASYEIQFGNSSGVLSYVIAQVTSLPCDIVLLAINNSAGKATIVGSTSPQVVIPYSTTAGAVGNLNAGSLATGDVIYAETLNMRDIGNIVDAVASGALRI